MAFKMRGFSGFGEGTSSSFKDKPKTSKPGVWNAIKKIGGRLNTIMGAHWLADEGSKVLTNKPIHKNIIDFLNPKGKNHGGKATVRDLKRKSKEHLTTGVHSQTRKI
tara:strand:+ start:30 stop:350 length:321 start_codon:yes stop_codon:yes gene_type:complete